MSSSKTRFKELQYQTLNEDLKRKISELHLLILSGKLSPEQMSETERALSELKKKMEDQGTHLRDVAGIPFSPPVNFGSENDQ